MPEITKPSGEQIRFNSSKTGEHSLDAYLEACEIGNRRLYDLLDDLFDNNGNRIVGLFSVWRSSWVAGAVYSAGDGFYDPATDNIYLVKTNHTSSTISADTTASKIEKIIDVALVKTYRDQAVASAATAAFDATATAADRLAVSSDKATVTADKATVAADKTTTQAYMASAQSADTSAQSAKIAAESARDAAIAAVGGVKITINDITTEPLDGKVSVSGLLTKAVDSPGADETLTLSVPVASQAEAEAGLAADKAMTPERTKQAIISLAPTAPLQSQIDTLKTNLAMTIIRLIANAGSSYMGMVDGWADEFEDQTGIGSLGTATYDAVGDYIHNPGWVITNSTAGAWSGQTGHYTFSGSNIQKSTVSQNAMYVTTSVSGDFEFEATVGYSAVSGSEIYMGVFAASEIGTWSSTTDAGNTRSMTNSYAIRMSEDVVMYGASNVAAFTRASGDVFKFKRVGSTITLHKNGSVFHTFSQTFSGDMKLFLQGYNTDDAWNNVSWRVVSTYANVTVTSISKTADAVPSQGRVTLVVDPQVAVTYGTDNRIRMSRDGGTTWVTGTMVIEAVNLDFPGGYTVDVVTASFDFTGTPSGTSMVLEWATFNNKHQLLHAWYPEWKV